MTTALVSSKISKPYEYKLVFKHGKSIKGNYWRIVAKPIKSRPRIGLAISKKYCRLSVDRNRLKRIARETFRLNQKCLDNWDFVIMIRKFKLVTNKLLTDELLTLLQKITKT
jgi:ribonuclease P protein component